jgi:lipoate-protein ligase A
MKLYRPGMLRGDESQAIYHVLAARQEEAVVLCRPSSCCVCLGFHDDLLQEIDQEFCSVNSIPLIRRETGGGVVLLDCNQLFFQLILHKDNPLLRGRRDRFFQKFLAPVIATLQAYGLQAELQEPADLVIRGRKISGNGAGDINGCAVYIGNILFDFNKQLMSRIIKVPNEAFRKAMEQALGSCLTTLADELAEVPEMDRVEQVLAEKFISWLPDLKPACYDEALQQATRIMAQKLQSQEILQLPGKKIKARQVKIKEATYLRLHFFPNVDCGDYAIFLIQEGIIVNFTYYGTTFSSAAGWPPLATYLIGVSWQIYPVSAAIELWLMHTPVSHTISRDSFVEWIIEGG